MNGSMMEDRRVWLGGGVLVALLLVAASWLMLISPKLDSADSLQSARDDAETSNQLLQSNNIKLAKQSRDMTALQAKLRTALAGLPGDSAFAEFTREVTSLATRSQVGLTTITISAPTSDAPAAAPATTGAGSASSAPAAAPTAASGSAISSIDVTLATTGSGQHQTAFLTSLQNGSRRALVTSSQLSVGGSSRVNSLDSATTMTTQLTIFTAPMSAGELRSIQQDLAAK